MLSFLKKLIVLKTWTIRVCLCMRDRDVSYSSAPTWVARDEFVKNRPKCSPRHFLSKNALPWQSIKWPKMWAISVIFTPSGPIGSHWLTPFSCGWFAVVCGRHAEQWSVSPSQALQNCSYAIGRQLSSSSSSRTFRRCTKLFCLLDVTD
jgi:hypothetical protein